MTEKELLEKIKTIVGRILPDLIRNRNNFIRTGIVQKTYDQSRIVDVLVNGTNEALNNLRFVANNPSSVTAGMPCLIISPDSNVVSKNFIIIFD